MSHIKGAIQEYINDMKSYREPIPRDIDIIGNVEVNA
jgi:predicted RNase H-like HicB family nuclease